MKHKTSFTVEDAIWTEFLLFTIKKTGNSRMVSEMLERAIVDYMKKNS